MAEIEIPIKLLSPEAKMPTKAHSTDAGFDLYSIKDTYIPSGKVVKIKTGIAVNIPPGYVGFIKDRSSMGVDGFKVFGGVIDAGYTGELIVALGTISHAEFTCIDYTYLVKSNRFVEAGSKIAQLVILPLPTAKFVEVDSFEQTDRSDNGFGSSGN